MLLVVLPDNFDDEAYYKLKAIAFNENQISQFLRITTFERRFPLVFWNLAISLYAKMEGIPWTLALRPPLEKEHIDVDLFIGICFVQRDLKSFVGVATVLDRLSEHIISISSKPISYVGKQLHMTREDICSLISECLNNVQFGVDSVVVHYATPFNEEEVAGLNDALKNVAKKALVHIETETMTRLYSLDMPDRNVYRGTALFISKDKAILCTTGRCRLLGTSTELEDEVEEWEGGITTSFRYRGISTPKPIGLNKIGDLDMETICRQVLALTKLRWNTAEVNIRIPATIEYARKIGYLRKYGIPRTVRNIKYIL
jgi:argonaute-like protein implicated in RNA metabolism and viral defense